MEPQNRRTEKEFEFDCQKSSLAQKVEPEYTFSSLSSFRVMVISNPRYNSDPLISCLINMKSLLLKHRLHIRHCIARHRHCPGQSISILILIPNQGESFRQSFASLELILLRLHLCSFHSMLPAMLFVNTHKRIESTINDSTVYPSALRLSSADWKKMLPNRLVD